MITTHAQESVDADVLGPAYSLNPPTGSSPDALELARTFETTWDNATTAWIQSMQQAWRMPFGFGNFMWGRFARSENTQLGEWKPDFDVRRSGHAVTVSAMLPGATEDDVEVEIRDGKLMIAGECNFSEQDGSSDHFSESIDLLNLVDSHSVEARIDDEGFLEISLKLHAPS